MDDVGTLAMEQAHQMPQQQRLAQRIQAAAIHRHRLPAQAQCTQLLAVGTVRGDQQHLMPGRAQRQRQRAAEVVEVPVGVGEQH
jgi:hypothetical protein